MKLIEWIVYSSVDSEKVSKFFKNLVMFIPSFVLFLGFWNVHVDSDSIKGILDMLGISITAIFSAITAVHTLIGAVRKLWTTAAGTNAVLNS